MSLDGDLVRMWRDDLGAELRNPETQLMGLTRWADLLIVRGLAAESRRHLRFERHDTQSDAFTWLIA
jgi:hypothetical protein